MMTIRGWRASRLPDPVCVSHLPPRCGKPITLDGRFERGGIPGDPGHPPVCGRPVHDSGPCRSAEALARYAVAQSQRKSWLRRPPRDRRVLAGAA